MKKTKKTIKNRTLLKKKDNRKNINQTKLTSISNIEKSKNNRRKKNSKDKEKYKLLAKPAWKE